ncbi:MAG: hypothetical protein ABW174_14785 [Flavitalea sp.]
MIKGLKFVLFFSLITVFSLACSDSSGKKSSDADSATTTKGDPEKGGTDTTSLTREIVNPAAVAAWSEKVKNPLNDWKFKVELFETKETFKYLMTIEFEEMKEKDTLKVPNLGFAPRLQIKKGDEEYSCIIGFLDNKDQFREWKKVIASSNNLKVKTLKQYGVYLKPVEK